MKNSQRGSVLIILIIITFLLVIAAGAYIYIENEPKNVTSSQQSIIDQPVVAATQQTATNQNINDIAPAQTENPPTGFLYPDESKIPSWYTLHRKAFTDQSVLYTFIGTTSQQYISFIDTESETYDYDLSLAVSSPLSKSNYAHVIKTFTYQNTKATLVGDYDPNAFDNVPLRTANNPDDEYYLIYDYNGGLVEIHTYDVNVFTPDVLTQLLESMKVTN